MLSGKSGEQVLSGIICFHHIHHDGFLISVCGTLAISGCDALPMAYGLLNGDEIKLIQLKKFLIDDQS